MDPALAFSGLVIGFSIAAPVGPIGVLCIRRTLAEGRAAGLACGLGAATADAVYGAAAAFGLTAVTGPLIAGQGTARRVADESRTAREEAPAEEGGEAPERRPVGRGDGSGEHAGERVDDGEAEEREEPGEEHRLPRTPRPPDDEARKGRRCGLHRHATGPPRYWTAAGARSASVRAVA